MLTTELRKRFDTSFHKIMSRMTADIQAKWDGKIEWHDNKMYPTINPAIISALPEAARAAYVVLLNQLSRGVI